MNEPSQDLAYIRHIIDKSRRAARIDALPLAVWGGLTIVGVIATLLVPRVDSVWLWVGLIAVAWVYTGVRAFSQRRKADSVVFAQRILSTLWVSLLAAMTVIGFAGAFSGVLPPQAIPAVFGGMFGVGCLTSAVLVEKRWLAVCALGWWLGAMTLFILPSEWRLAGYGVLMLVFLIAPALAIHRGSSDS